MTIRLVLRFAFVIFCLSAALAHAQDTTGTAKNVDGRIDDPNAGWKGKALWSTYGTRTMYHLKGARRTGQRPSRSSFVRIRSRGELLSGRPQDWRLSPRVTSQEVPAIPL